MQGLLACLLMCRCVPSQHWLLDSLGCSVGRGLRDLRRMIWAVRLPLNTLWMLLLRHRCTQAGSCGLLFCWIGFICRNFWISCVPEGGQATLWYHAGVGPLKDEGKQCITRFYVSLNVVAHTRIETWGIVQQVSGDGAKVCYEN